VPGAFKWELAAPAGALSSTAADMARFMIAHLNRGRQGTTRILKEETVEAMQRHRFSNHPAGSGLTYGFQELHIAGQRVLAQPGDMLHFTAAVFLLPEQELGLFVAYDRSRAADAPMELLRAFLARFSPAPAAFVHRGYLEQAEAYLRRGNPWGQNDGVHGLNGGVQVRC
jgi:CubicO group peptidase (beta-lactamase class C family)